MERLVEESISVEDLKVKEWWHSAYTVAAHFWPLYQDFESKYASEESDGSVSHGETAGDLSVRRTCDKVYV